MIKIRFIRALLTLSLIASITTLSISPAFACGPVDIVPAFTSERTPEFPYTDFANGNLGIVSPKYPRIVLFAAYRYLGGGNFSSYEREKLAEAWNDFFNRRSADQDRTTEAVKDWIAERASVITDEEKPPAIYVEKPYEGFDFFPNCSKNAFEVAKDTLSDRASSHGSDDQWVREWVRGQDVVFQNCGDSRSIPAPAAAEMPDWLKKDRAYQTAAAEFYSLNYTKAKELFAQIATDSDSPWQQVAEYLVPRSLVRAASLSKNKTRSSELYTEAEQDLENIYAGGGEYSQDAERMLGLVKYRIHPEQRVQELAQNLSYHGGDNLKQDLIDYTWLMDRFEAKALEAEEKKRAIAKRVAEANEGNSNSNLSEEAANAALEAEANPAANLSVEDFRKLQEQEQRQQDEKALQDAGYLKVVFFDDDYNQSWTIWIRQDASDDEAWAEAEKAAGPLTDNMKERIRYARQSAYRDQFLSQDDVYDGAYWGNVEPSVELLPPFLIANDLTDWLFSFQMSGEAAYEHSLTRFRQTGSDAWLISALSKAEPVYREALQLLDTAKGIPISSPAFPTAAYHRARLLKEAGKLAEARNAIDDVLNSGAELPTSARNEFLSMRMGLATSLDDFLKYSLRKPFAFSWADDYTSIDDIVARQKSYYNPEYYTETREEYEQSIEDQYKYARQIQAEMMLDHDSIEVINYHLPLNIFVEIEKSELIPDYLRGRFALAIWTRAVLLGDFATADRFVPDVIKYHPESESDLNAYKNAAAATKRYAAVFAILKNERATPYIAGGFGSASEGITYSSKWWCEVGEDVWDEDKQEMVPVDRSNRPPFVSTEQSDAAKQEMKALSEISSAPEYLAKAVLDWMAKYPRDPQIPEALYLSYKANDWDKYGCGGDNDLRQRARDALLRRYPSSGFAQQVRNEQDNDQ